MQKTGKVWGWIGSGLGLLWLVLKLYDSYLSNNDGVLLKFNINVLFGYLASVWAVLALVSMGIKSRRSYIANASLSVGSFLFFWILAEIICLLLITTGLSGAGSPFHSRLLLSDKWLSYQKVFWADLHPHLARWRPANDTFKALICNGDSVLIVTNSHGARDKERNRSNPSKRKRVVMLGDSFVEGYIVNAHQRHSDILEDETQHEHLNFGLNGTSPINYYLTYKHLAKDFDHDVVTVGILPANDFEDYTPHQKGGLLHYPIYRPYWEGEFPNASIQYSLAHINQSIGAPSSRNNLIHIQNVVDSIYQTFSLKEKILMELRLNSYLYNHILKFSNTLQQQKHQNQGSFKAEFFESRWPAFEHSLVQLMKEAKGKKVIFYVIPILSDLEAYHQNRTDDLSPRLQALCERHGVTYINLLPSFYAQGPAHWSRFYEPCDGHFTVAGERFVADILLNHKEYQRALNIAR